MRKIKNKRIRIVGIIIAALFLIGLCILIYASILRGMGAVETKVYEKDGDTLIIHNEGDIFTVKEPSIKKYNVRDKIFVIEKNGKISVLPNLDLLEIISTVLIAGPFTLCAIFIIIKNFVLNIKISKRVFNAVIFITIVYIGSISLMLLATGSFDGEVDMLVVDYAIAAYIVLILFVLNITRKVK